MTRLVTNPARISPYDGFNILKILGTRTGRGAVAERGKKWLEWLPGWMPICTAILGAAVWMGRYTQQVDDHLQQLDDRMTHVEQYMQAQTVPMPMASGDHAGRTPKPVKMRLQP